MPTKNLKKFGLNKPLYLFSDSYYPDKFLLKYKKFEPSKEFNLFEYSATEIVDLSNIGKIIFGVEVDEVALEKYDHLLCYEGIPFEIVHQRILDKLNELCPNDIQAIPMVVKNLHHKKESFENRSFWLINVLNELDIIDYEKTAEYSSKDIDTLLKSRINLEHAYLKNADHMNGHLIALIKAHKSSIIFHPSLAGHFAKSKGIQFLTDDDIVMAYRDELWLYLHAHYGFIYH